MKLMLGISLVTLETVWHGTKLLDLSLDPDIYCDSPEVGQKVIIGSEEYEIVELKWIDHEGALIPVFRIQNHDYGYVDEKLVWEKRGFTFTRED